MGKRPLTRNICISQGISTRLIQHYPHSSPILSLLSARCVGAFFNELELKSHVRVEVRLLDPLCAHRGFRRLTFHCHSVFRGNDFHRWWCGNNGSLSNLVAPEERLALVGTLLVFFFDNRFGGLRTRLHDGSERVKRVESFQYSSWFCAEPRLWDFTLRDRRTEFTQLLC